jgi:hypothetical protein
MSARTGRLAWQPGQVRPRHRIATIEQGEFAMNYAEKIEAFKAAGMAIDDSKMSEQAKQLIDSMSDDEVNAAISARAKIGDADQQAGFDESVHAHGF